jgi:hypothetical protein
MVASRAMPMQVPPRIFFPPSFSRQSHSSCGCVRAYIHVCLLSPVILSISATHAIVCNDPLLYPVLGRVHESYRRACPGSQARHSSERAEICSSVTNRGQPASFSAGKAVTADVYRHFIGLPAHHTGRRYRRRERNKGLAGWYILFLLISLSL